MLAEGSVGKGKKKDNVGKKKKNAARERRT
jgi:hypothetical protein